MREYETDYFYGLQFWKFMSWLSRCVIKVSIVILAAAVFYSRAESSGPVKIGNSDDGRDLEQLNSVNSGIIVETQAQALALLEKLNVAGIPGLGMLSAEVQKTAIFLAKSDVEASIRDDFRPDHLSSDRKVYARTIAEPHAPTRFFPIATTLPPEQLVRLHIHEGLHRALPADIREDEAAVSQLTLAITDPSSSHDRVKTVASRLIKVKDDRLSFRKDLYPSFFGYSLKHFRGANLGTSFDVSRAHVVQSFLYPFGSEESTFGLGIEFSAIERNSEFTSGPLGLSFRWKALTARGFDVDFFGGIALNTLSFQELRDSPYGRDVYSLGLSLRREIKSFYIENSVNVRNGGEAKQNIGAVDYTYTYGNIIEPAVHVGFLKGDWRFGGYFNLFLSEGLKVSGGSFYEDKGRFRVMATGPEISYGSDGIAFTLAGRFLVDATADADLSTLGLLDTWVGRGGVQVSIGFGL